MALGVQAQLQVSKPADPAEMEADATAQNIMRMELPPERGKTAAPASMPAAAARPPQRSAMPQVLARRGYQLAAPALARKAKRADAEHAEPDVESDLHAAMGGGMALPAEVYLTVLALEGDSVRLGGRGKGIDRLAGTMSRVDGFPAVRVAPPRPRVGLGGDQAGVPFDMTLARGNP